MRYVSEEGKDNANKKSDRATTWQIWTYRISCMYWYRLFFLPVITWSRSRLKFSDCFLLKIEDGKVVLKLESIRWYSVANRYSVIRGGGEFLSLPISKSEVRSID